jgi:DNA-binding beta-propeller fold protein YncE
MRLSRPGVTPVVSQPKEIMATVFGVSPTSVHDRDFSRYRSTVIMGVVLFALSAVVMALFSRSGAPSIAGEPGYLFSIPDERQGSEERVSLDGPLAVAAYGDVIAVADSGRGTIKLFAWNGKYISETVVPASGKGSPRRSYPTGVAFDDVGNLFVVDVTSDRIHVFDSKMTQRYTFPERREEVRLMQPVAIAIAGDEVYVTDVGDSSVKVFGLDGSFIRQFAKSDERSVALAFPNGIGVSLDGTVYVADSNNRKVFAFDLTGRELFAFKHRFSLPRGIAVDAVDRVHVVDTFAHRVVVFDGSGRALFEYGHDESAGVQLGFANGICVDSQTARVYIADRSANRVQVWGWEQAEE